MDEEIEKVIARMKAAGESQSFIDDVVAKLRGQPAPTAAPEHVALTIGSASAEDISAVSIDADYWAKQDVKREDVVLGENKEHDDQIKKEEKLAKSVRTSGDTSEEAVEYSSPDENWGLVKDEDGADDYGATTKKLRDAYTRYGFDIKRPYDEDFDFSFSGKEEVRVTADNGEVKTFNLSNEEAKQTMDDWMRSRAVDKFADFEKSLEGIAITSKERKKAAEDSGGEFDSFIKEAQDLEAAQVWKEGDEPLKNNKWHKEIQDAKAKMEEPGNRAQLEKRQEKLDKLMGMSPSDIGSLWVY